MAQTVKSSLCKQYRQPHMHLRLLALKAGLLLNTGVPSMLSRCSLQ